MQTIWDSSQWYSNPKAYWTLKYEYKRSGKDMLYRFYWKVWIGAYSWYDDAFTLRLFLNGVQHDVSVKGKTTSLKGWSYEGTTGWYTVSNKISGTVPFYAQMYNSSAVFVAGTSSSYDLYVYPAEATVKTATDFNDESNPTITFENLGGYSLKPYITFYVNGTLVKVIERAIGSYSSPYKWSLTDAEREELRTMLKDRNGCEACLGLDTYIGSTILGYHSIEKKFSIVNANPIFTASQISYTDANKALYKISGDANDNQKIVQNQSSLSVTFGAAKGSKGATISQYALTLLGVTKTASASGSVSFGAINSSQDVTLSVTVKDSRGNTTTVEKTIKMIAWSLPIFTASVERLNNYEDETYLTVDASISSVDGKNTIKSITYQLMEAGGSYGEPMTIAEGVKSFKETITIPNGLNKEKEFFFLITVEDEFDYDNKEIYLAKGKFPLFINTEKYSVGINEFPEEGEALRVAGGVARFDDGIVLVLANRKFLLSVNDSGQLSITEMK